MLPVHPKILAMKLPELPKPLFVLVAQLLVDIFNVLVRKFSKMSPSSSVSASISFTTSSEVISSCGVAILFGYLQVQREQSYK